MGIRNRDGALFMATGIDNSGLYAGRREAMGIIKAMAGQITSFDVFSGIGISAATAFASAAKSSYDFEKEFQKNMLEVATISTQVEGSMTDFMNRVMAITQEIPVKAPEAAKALYQIVSAGHDGADGMNVLEVAARSAIGGMTDTATAADAITTLINAYKLSASDAERVSDQLFTTARQGKTTFGELGQSIAQVAPIAASYGVEMDQVLAAVATLTKSGTPTAQAMIQIRAAIVGVSKYLGDGTFNTMTFQDALDKVAKEANGSESALRAMIPEIEAVNGVLGMTGIKAQDAAADLKAMNESAGSTEAAFKLMMNDVDKQMTLLSNNIQAALRPMGQAILKEVSEVATAFNEAFENGEAKEAMKMLGDLIVIVTGAFIGYKGSVLGSAAAHNIYARAMVVSRLAAIKHVTTTKLMTNAIKAQTVALLKNTAAFLTNPYVLAAAAVAALGYAVYKYATQATAAEKATAAHNKRVKDLSDWAKKTKEDVDGMLSSLRDENVLMTEKIEIYKALRKLYPDELENISLQNFLLMDSVQANNLLAKALDERIKAQQRADVNVIESEMKTNDSRIASLEGKNGMNTSVGEWFELRRLKSRNEQLKIEYEKAKDIVIQGLKDEAAARKAAEDLNNDNEKGETVLQRKIALTKELSDAEVKLKKLRAPDSTAKNSEIKAAEDKVKEVKGKLEALAGIAVSSNTLASEQADRLKAIEDYRKSISEVQAEFDIRQVKIDAMDEGSAKELAQINLNYDKLRDVNRRHANDMIKEQQELERKQWEYDNPKWKEKGMTFKPITTSAQQLSQLQQAQLTSYDNYADKSKQKATKEQLENEKRMMNEYLKEYGTYMEKRQAITVLYNEKMKKAVTQGEKLSLGEEMMKELASVDDQVQKKTSIITQLFSDMGKRSVADMRSIADEAQKMLDYINTGEFNTGSDGKGLFGLTKEQFDILSKSPEKLQAIKDEIANVNREADQMDTSFNKVSNGLKKVFSAGDDTKKLKEGLAEIDAGMNDVMQAGQFLSDTFSKLGDAFGSDLMSGIAEGLNVAMDAMDSAMKGAQAGSMFGPIGAAAGAAVGAVTSLVSSFAKIHDAKNEKRIQRLQDQIEVLDKSYDKLGRSVEKAYSSDASNLIDQQNKMLEQQKLLIQQQIAEEEDKKCII